ncbi:putative KEX1 protein [Polychytrium aggregatum]|uniref:putative KEX1 protein n=1 Tax=Polychytrium aggregatum TaxID=110093 RepID=UPI0022FF0E4F|nr:putative KEX1 protein [Polychytrium aggregatum]KAI9205870.1 putative KEX1 protein [Polychytrium aggregatum]
MTDETAWCAYKFLAPGEAIVPGHTALIVLNQPVCRRSVLESVWRNASLRICADGGANRLFDAFEDNVQRALFIPDYIRGDLDSIRPEVRVWYEQQGVSVGVVEDQYSTDFQKCLHLLGQVESERGIKFDRVLVLGGIGGRFDQTMHNIHVLHLLGRSRVLYMISNESVSFLLMPGKHRIECSKAIEGPTCGILPIGTAVANVITHGLKWDLDETMPSSFSQLVSTSNQFPDDSGPQPQIHVETDAPVVWTVEVHLY